MGNLNMANVQMGFLDQIFFPQQTERGLQDAILVKANMALFCIQFQIATVSVGKKFLLRCIYDTKFSLSFHSKDHNSNRFSDKRICHGPGCYNIFEL